MEKLIFKSFDKSIKDVKSEMNNGTISELSWETLKPYLSHAFNKKPNEEVVALQITKDGIRMKFKRIKNAGKG